MKSNFVQTTDTNFVSWSDDFSLQTRRGQGQIKKHKSNLQKNTSPFLRNGVRLVWCDSPFPIPSDVQLCVCFV